ncbi:hypothetical protein NBRC110019_20930 [Neptunitalea chrysea]|uniref:Major capsid protein n=1 Tax=Neptunitalea chrysea TaxID=1647581 RepID=A0A9W6B8R7_9FLAO|nr:hypothetical protein [Neptunitalea chrysea]GLB53053.1 hypothetical protein NBRC110019_20930 [Neptunitalea chrysea]
MELKSAFQELATDERFIQDSRDIIKNDLFYQPTDNFFTIVPGIKGGQQVAAMKGFEYITTASQGCGGAGISPSFPAFTQTWNPKLQEVKVSYCYDDFMGHFTQWALANGYAVKDIGQTELGLFLQDLIVKAMQLDLQRMVLMADADIENQDILTDEATYAQYYNTIDKGLIPTLQYLKTLPEFADKFVALDKNAATTVADQYDLGSEYALGIYEGLTDQYDFDGDVLLSSNRLFKNYTKWIKRANGYGVQSNIDDTLKGVKDASVDGEKVLPLVNYDRWRANDFTIGDPATIHLPHFALFTRKEFLQVGIDDAAALENLTFEYIGGSEETFWIKGNYMLDFKMVNPYALKAAF